MKKNYISPKLNIVDIELNRMICVSGADLDTTQEVNSGNIGSRRRGFWDDEDNDEY